MLQDRLDRISDYFVGMDRYNGVWVVRVKYRPKWSAYPPEDGSIKVGADDSEPDLWWYCAKDETVGIDSILDLVEETVQTNMEAIKKVELFKIKAGELKRIFSDETISLRKLESLTFVFKENSVATTDGSGSDNGFIQEKKKNVPSKKDLITKVGDEIKGHDVFSSDSVAVEESVSKKKTSRKKNSVVESVVEGVTPDTMTQEEINDLRG